MVYKCPICDSIINKKLYQTIVYNIAQEQKKIRERIDIAKGEGLELGSNRHEKDIKHLTDINKALEERIKILENDTTSQLLGYVDETELTELLKENFPDDSIEHKGKKGDVLHIVIVEKQPIAKIVYECKRVARIQQAHLRQTYKAKEQRSADIAILVTCGSRTDFAGYLHESDVHIVNKLTVIPIVDMIRTYLVEYNRINGNNNKNEMLQSLQLYLSNGTPHQMLDNISHHGMELQKELQREIKSHITLWTMRNNHICNIVYDSNNLHDDIRKVVGGIIPTIHQILKPPTLYLQSSNNQLSLSEANDINDGIKVKDNA
jgi:hypothetical protein